MYNTGYDLLRLSLYGIRAQTFFGNVQFDNMGRNSLRNPLILQASPNAWVQYRVPFGTVCGTTVHGTIHGSVFLEALGSSVISGLLL